MNQHGPDDHAGYHPSAQHYAQPQKPKSWPRRHPILTVVLALFVVVTIASAMGNASKPAASSAAVAASGGQAPPTAPVVIRVTSMGDDFEANQIAAERKWGGQFIQFTAPVSNINSYGVSFGNVTSKFSFTQVSCDLKDEDVLATLTKGKPATVRGVVGKDQILGVISLKQCQVVT